MIIELLFVFVCFFSIQDLVPKCLKELSEHSICLRQSFPGENQPEPTYPLREEQERQLLTVNKHFKHSPPNNQRTNMQLQAITELLLSAPTFIWALGSSTSFPIHSFPWRWWQRWLQIKQINSLIRPFTWIWFWQTTLCPITGHKGSNSKRQYCFNISIYFSNFLSTNIHIPKKTYCIIHY